ncbi:Ribosomal protein S20 [Candidatus Endolissoclinum faulkneri L2]|uniref:Small ribosomal subunit protein bS20 n=1 Tax=Candidatus Endolissoclinum faulkneri L2 TaxID=1193729 RepID=K7Z4P0_9PROT|nr:30S ribosomal protein S20 [Candidatus Endolissoclinum faulkneri]AFX98963.1 Ribosomal protein S20 [Candidatus Endolissoclinum faulkneri L2]
MANHISAEKRIRHNTRRYAINHSRISRIRTQIKHVKKVIADGNHAGAMEVFKVLQKEMHRGVSKGVMHRNKVARNLSRLNSKIKAISN